jgi:hypothetical protein
MQTKLNVQCTKFTFEHFKRITTKTEPHSPPAEPQPNLSDLCNDPMGARNESGRKDCNPTPRVRPDFARS